MKAQSSYADALSTKSATLSIKYFNSDHFISDASGELAGIEYDILLAFKDYLKTQGLDVTLNFQKAESFSQLYASIQEGKSGEFGACSFSITPKRLQEVNFSPKYMPDIEVLICSQNIPVATDTNSFLANFTDLTALNVPNTTFEEDINKVKALIPNLKVVDMEYAREIRERIATEDNLFSYIELPNYLITIKEGTLLKRQAMFKNERWGYGIIFPKSSDWAQPINDFFESTDFKRKVNQILKKHLGEDLQDLLWEVGSTGTSADTEEIALLTKEREIQNVELKKNEIELAKEAIYRKVLITGVVVALIVIVLVIISYRIKRRANLELALRNKEIEEQKVVIEAKNKDITDSIIYAQNIQKALLPDFQILKQRFTDHFLLFKPRDIVSGDFYWFTEIENTSIIVLADCTGHGVPGAMVSMMGCNYLNQIVNDNEITTPAQALNELDKMVTNSLQNTDAQSADGMDIVMFSHNRDKQEITFAGGKNNIYHCNSEGLHKYKGDKFSIGSDGNEDKIFTDKTFKVNEGDIIYTFTDGYPDQFGGKKGKKLKVKNLINHLTAIQAESMSTQQVALEDELKRWMSGYSQVDDISVLGVKI